MKPQYHKGAEARQRFEEGMKELFRVPKSAVAKKPKPKKKASGPKGENEN
jgi:hypothetical protein